ncbi:hypothetical protein B0H12DRAFT_1287893 [Mycena haematopus]|nr:hypothetical protein B0H12DRAFT_1287893 [Mycena haematopus]
MPFDQRSKLFDFTAFAALKPPRPIAKPPNQEDSRPHQRCQLLPTEIFERILDFLYADKNALLSCSLVCRDWFPTSRFHLYTLLPVIPVAVGETCHKVNTAIALTDNAWLYGTNNGVFLSRNGALVKVLKLPAVTQIDALQSHDLLLVLSGRRLLAGPLHLTTSNTPALLHARLTILSSDTSFFQVGDHAGKRVVCIVHAGRFSSHFKLLEVPAPNPSQSNPHTLQHLRSFYLPDRARSVYIWNSIISAGLRTAGFQKCRAMFRANGRYLLCYDRCAFYIDKTGTSFEAEFAIRWDEPAKQFAHAPPYLLAFTPAGLHVWHTDTGARVQMVHSAGIRLLSAGPRILVRMGHGNGHGEEGRVLALRCQEPYVASVREWEGEVGGGR